MRVRTVTMESFVVYGSFHCNYEGTVANEGDASGWTGEKKGMFAGLRRSLYIVGSGLWGEEWRRRRPKRRFALPFLLGPIFTADDAETRGG